MKRFAINVVILPPEPVMELVIEWNNVLCKTRPANIVLGKTNYLPHISMAMGCLREDQFEHANNILRSIAKEHQALELQVPHIRTVSSASGERVITFDIDPSQELVAVHESIVNAFRPLLTQDADETAINDDPPISPDAIGWINHYIPHQCFDNFWPHITLGFGEPPPNFQLYSFQASRLAICHLGNHCTCKNILTEAFLKSK